MIEAISKGQGSAKHNVYTMVGAGPLESKEAGMSVHEKDEAVHAPGNGTAIP